MAQLFFPPSGWFHNVTTSDTIILNYTSTYSGIDINLWCTPTPRTSNPFWNYEALVKSLPPNGFFNLNLPSYNISKSANVAPEECHFEFRNSSNETEANNAGDFILTNSTDKAQTTFSQLQPSTTSATASATTSHVLSSTKPAEGTASATNASDPSSGANSRIKVGVAVGIGVGVALFLIICGLLIAFWRKRGRGRSAPLKRTNDEKEDERAELSGHAVSIYNTNKFPGATSAGQDEHCHQGQPQPAQELIGSIGSPARKDVRQFRFPPRYELSG